MELFTVNIIASDLLEVVFLETIRNSEDLQEASNWTITLLQGQGSDVIVKNVNSGDAPGIANLYIDTSAISPGAFYCLESASSLIDISGTPIVGDTKTVIKGRNTKIDNTIRSRSDIYDARSTALYRQILNVFGREDDRIGGSQDEGEDILPECP